MVSGKWREMLETCTKTLMCKQPRHAFLRCSCLTYACLDLLCKRAFRTALTGDRTLTFCMPTIKISHRIYVLSHIKLSSPRKLYPTHLFFGIIQCLQFSQSHKRPNILRVSSNKNWGINKWRLFIKASNIHHQISLILLNSFYSYNLCNNFLQPIV